MGTIASSGCGRAARPSGGARASVGPQAIIYFGIAGGAAALALSLLYDRYIRRDPRAVHSRGGFTYFAIFMLMFSLGAAIAGIVAVRAGR